MKSTTTTHNNNTFTLKSQLHPNYYYLAETVSPKLNPIYPAKINTKICSQFSYLITGFDSPFDASIYIYIYNFDSEHQSNCNSWQWSHLSISLIFLFLPTYLNTKPQNLSLSSLLLDGKVLIDINQKNCESQAGFGPKKAAARAP